MLKSHRSRLRGGIALSFHHAYPSNFRRLTARTLWLVTRALDTITRMGIGCFCQQGSLKPLCPYHGTKARQVCDG